MLTLLCPPATTSTSVAESQITEQCAAGVGAGVQAGHGGDDDGDDEWDAKSTCDDVVGSSHRAAAEVEIIRFPP